MNFQRKLVEQMPVVPSSIPSAVAEAREVGGVGPVIEREHVGFTAQVADQAGLCDHRFEHPAPRARRKGGQQADAPAGNGAGKDCGHPPGCD